MDYVKFIFSRKCILFTAIILFLDVMVVREVVAWGAGPLLVIPMVVINAAYVLLTIYEYYENRL